MTAVAGKFSHLFNFAVNHPVSRQAPLRTLTRILSWQLKSRLRSGPFIHNWVGGTKLSVSRGMTGATGNIYFGLWEFSDMSLLLHFLRPEDQFLDVGANIGSFSILAAGVCGAQCLAFEPAPETLPLLRKNIDINDLNDRILVCDFALGEAEDMIMMTSGLGPMNLVMNKSGQLKEDQVVFADLDDATGLVEIPIKRLDDVTEVHNPVMMKVDVEGHEPAFFRGAEKILENPSLKIVQTETVTSDISDVITKHGFVQRYYDPQARHFSQKPIADKSHNAIYIRDEEAVLNRVRSAPLRTIGSVKV